MSDLVPSPAADSRLTRMDAGPGGSALTKLRSFTDQPAIRRSLPWFGGLAAVGIAALTWAVMADGPQRTLYASLSDAERASVAAALDTGGIGYTINNATGALSVSENDLYRARMLVAADGALAAPETGTDMLDSLPMGASRTLEGDRLRSAKERELMLTIGEIDGVEAVRVHLAQGDRSVFVRENIAPSASVMLRMTRGRQLADSQVQAIANLVAGSVPGLAAQSVQIVDQNGQLLSQQRGANGDRLELQSRMEAKLRAQIDQLLSPMIGAGNFSSEIQVELNMDEVTSARESYDPQGAIRRESVQESQNTAGAVPGVGVPGAVSNTPPADVTAEERAPQAAEAPGQAQTQASGESSATRTFELGREVAVSNTAPGSIKRLSVAVALNAEALAGTNPQQLAKIEQLVQAAVGADTTRGDQVAVLVRKFQPVEITEVPLWETPWFAMIVRNAVALIIALLVLLLAVRPLIKAFTRSRRQNAADPLALAGPGAGNAGLLSQASEGAGAAAERGAVLGAAGAVSSPDTLDKPTLDVTDHTQLHSQIAAAQRLAREKPDDALTALRRLLNESPADQTEATT